jgi:hypothetical protein
MRHTSDACSADAPPANGRAAGFTVADVCRRWRCGADKVRRLLAKGELLGVNVAGSLTGRPLWRIPPEEVERFERRRSSAPAPKPPRRRRAAVALDYYPD